MTYSKKKHYDIYSSLTFEDCMISGDKSAFVRQKGTFLRVDSELVQPSDIDVEILYSSGVMRKR